jgi:hypothetical protein
MPQGQVPPPEPARAAVDVDVLRALFLSPGDWIHRRVESVLMSPDGVTRRKVSLDVDLAAHDPWPADAAGRLLVPVTIQAKQPLRNFDAVCEGEPAPVLGTEDNGALAELLLRGLIPEQLPLAEAALLAEQHVPAVVHVPELLVEDALDRFWAHCEHLRAVVRELIARGRLSAEDAENWDGDFALFTTVADQLARGFLLTFALPAELAGRRLVLKYAMDEQYAAGRRPRAQDRLRHCWKPWVGRVGLHDLASCRSFHLELTVPAEVRLHEFTVLSAEDCTSGTGPDRAEDRAVDRVLAEDRTVRRWPGAVRGGVDRDVRGGGAAVLDQPAARARPLGAGDAPAALRAEPGGLRHADARRSGVGAPHPGGGRGLLGPAAAPARAVPRPGRAHLVGAPRRGPRPLHRPGATARAVTGGALFSGTVASYTGEVTERIHHGL